MTQTGTPGAPATSSTPNALRLRMVRRTIAAAIGVVVVLGGTLLWMESRRSKEASERQERARQHVILRPGDAAQDWRLKEGARVEELSRTIEGLERKLKQMQDQQAQEEKRAEAKAKEGQQSSRSRRDGKPAAPLPPLAEILPATPEAPAPGTKSKPAPEAGAPAPPRFPAAAPIPAEKADRPGGRPSAAPPKLTETRPPTAAAPATESGKLRVITPRAMPSNQPQADLGSVGWLPSGSFIRAMILSGVDAGTGTGKDLPYPVLMRLDDSAVLPNNYRMDLAECFVIGAAFGDLPSERVYIRTETLSCLRQTGGLITIDGELKGNAIGEDGKLGLRGRVVTKEGSIIARSMLAGFLGGISDAFKPRISYAPLTLGGTVDTGDQAFQLPPIQDTLQAAGIAGVGKSMEYLAKYYLEQARKLYPVIEIAAGRRINLVVLKGMPLKFRAAQQVPRDRTAVDVIE